MANIKGLGVISKNELKTHKMEFIVEFDEPVTQAEEHQIVLNAINSLLFKEDNGGIKL